MKEPKALTSTRENNRMASTTSPSKVATVCIRYPHGCFLWKSCPQNDTNLYISFINILKEVFNALFILNIMQNEESHTY